MFKFGDRKSILILGAKKIIAPKKIYASTPVEPVWSAAWRETFSNEKKQDSNITADFPIVFLVLHFWLAA